MKLAHENNKYSTCHKDIWMLVYQNLLYICHHLCRCMNVWCKFTFNYVVLDIVTILSICLVRLWNTELAAMWSVSWLSKNIFIDLLCGSPKAVCISIRILNMLNDIEYSVSADKGHILRLCLPKNPWCKRLKSHCLGSIWITVKRSYVQEYQLSR